MLWALVCVCLYMFFRAAFVECPGLFIQRYKVEPQFGSSVITTTLGSNVTLAWVCHTQGNYTLDKVYWSLFLHSEASRLPLLALKRTLDGNIKKTPMQGGGRVQWTGNATQEELSFVINDVRRSDDLWYLIRLKLVIPENDSFTVVHRKSYLRLKVAEKASYKGLTNKTTLNAQFGENVNFTWEFQKNDSSLKNMTAIRASLAIWKNEDQRFVELFVAEAESKTHSHPFQNKHLAHDKERITWIGNLTDLLFSFMMANISFDDEKEFYLLISFEEYVEPYKAILVFTSSYLEVQGSMGLTAMPTTPARKRGLGSPSLKVSAGTPKQSNKHDSTHSKNAVKIALISAVTSLVVIIIIITTLYGLILKPGDQQGRKRRQKQKEAVVTYKSTQEEVRMIRVTKCTGADSSKSTVVNSLRESESAPPLSPRAPRSHRWEFPKQRLQVREEFGHGAFGKVVKGLAFEIAGRVGWTMVAIKMLKEDASESDRHDLLSELSIMKKLPPHRHVVRLLGCVTTSANPLVIVEFACQGDLLGYLLKSRGLPDTYYQTTGKLTTVTAKKMMMFAWQIADGMNFLAKNKVVHRDLAARNVLVADGNVCKITDFGLAREVHENDMYTMTAGGRVPAKWTAYEALIYGVFTTQSDVWSYGVVMYEIFTLGGEPYAGIKTRDLVYSLGKGFRMRRPKHVDKELHAVMLSCWNEDPSKRPTFNALQETLTKLEKQQTVYINLQSFTDSSYVNVDNAVKDKVSDEAIL